jgi:hypothetical protein
MGIDQPLLILQDTLAQRKKVFQLGNNNTGFFQDYFLAPTPNHHTNSARSMKASPTLWIAVLLAACLLVDEPLLASSDTPLEAGQMTAIVRSDGLLVLLPQVAGPGTYGSYLVPNVLGRENPTRFMFKGNPLQMNFLPVDAFPEEFAALSPEEKLRYFFKFEALHQSQSLGTLVFWENENATDTKGEPHREGILNITLPEGAVIQAHIVARTAGNGILHGGWQSMEPESLTEAESLVRKMLDSFQLVPRALNTAELTRLSQEATRGMRE